jgi:thiamine kinase-like enzyme
VERYLVMADLGLTPPVICHGQLESGLPVIVQLCITGRRPSRADYRQRLTEVAELVSIMHNNPHSRGFLQSAPSNLYKDAGIRALDRLSQTWKGHKSQVPLVAESVDESLDFLADQVNQFSGEGLVASHGDICNANWLFAQDGKIYVLDFESMSLDDPAFDLGALLWWYYPPELRESFLNIAGYPYDEEFKARMRVRMAMHCLSILLPRAGSFDGFDAETFGEALSDFRAILEGKENPQGYE